MNCKITMQNWKETNLYHCQSQLHYLHYMPYNHRRSTKIKICRKQFRQMNITIPRLQNISFTYVVGMKMSYARVENTKNVFFDYLSNMVNRFTSIRGIRKTCPSIIYSCRNRPWTSQSIRIRESYLNNH